MSSLSGLTRAVSDVGACTKLTWQINVSFEGPGCWRSMGTLLDGLGSGWGSLWVSSPCTDCLDGLLSICARPRASTRREGDSPGIATSIVFVCLCIRIFNEVRFFQIVGSGRCTRYGNYLLPDLKRSHTPPIKQFADSCVAPSVAPGPSMY